MKSAREIVTNAPLFGRVSEHAIATIAELIQQAREDGARWMQDESFRMSDIVRRSVEMGMPIVTLGVVDEIRRLTLSVSPAAVRSVAP